jgi:hypothetical protein
MRSPRNGDASLASRIEYGRHGIKIGYRAGPRQGSIESDTSHAKHRLGAAGCRRYVNSFSIPCAQASRDASTRRDRAARDRGVLKAAPNVTTTTAAYLNVSQNLVRMQAGVAAEPANQTAAAYYAANIGKVTSISQFVGNYRLLSYALNAYGLSDQIHSTALITQVLQGGVTSSSALANTLTNPAWKAFATAFNFVGQGASSISTSSAIATTESDYNEQQLESEQGSQDVGVQLALYFQRVAPTVTNEYGILGDKNLLEVVQTIFGISPDTSAENIDAQAAQLSQVLPISDLQDPTKLQQLTERFTAEYDATYGPASNSGATPLTVTTGDTPTQTSAASTILSGVISGTSSNISSLFTTSTSASTFSTSLLSALQGFTLGG